MNFHKKMKCTLLVAILFQVILVSAQNADMKRVETQIERFRLALIDPTAEKMDDLVMENLTYGHSSGRIEDKKTFVENLLNSNSDFTAITFSDQKITLEKRTAVVRHKISAQTNDRGKSPGEINLNIMMVWVKQGKNWKLLARQAVKLQ